MKIPRFIACLTALLCMAAGCRSEDDAAVRALARRIIPEHEKQFRFERLTDTTECFELESRGSKIIVRGNSSASIAVGLNHYLKNYCLTTVSWHACNPVEMPAVLPRIDEKVRVESRARERFFLNYCTFGYTMPWWGWTEWERFIDWMALQGVTMPLAITGQEAVWQRVWTRLGLSDEEVRAYFTGPAHLPWHRMSNIDRWQGPLPEEWIDGQLALQQRILARERELGMKPVLPAFAGHVPQELKRLHPDARITRVSYWGGFDDRYRCSFLDPMDPLFAVIQREFLTEQTRLFGTGHIYGADPFNEIDAPTWDPETLAGMSRPDHRQKINRVIIIPPYLVQRQPQILQNADVADFSKGINGVIAVPGISLLDIGTDQTVLLIIQDHAPCHARRTGDFPDREQLLSLRHKQLPPYCQKVLHRTSISDV